MDLFFHSSFNVFFFFNHTDAPSPFPPTQRSPLDLPQSILSFPLNHSAYRLHSFFPVSAVEEICISHSLHAVIHFSEGHINDKRRWRRFVHNHHNNKWDPHPPTSNGKGVMRTTTIVKDIWIFASDSSIFLNYFFKKNYHLIYNFLKFVIGMKCCENFVFDYGLELYDLSFHFLQFGLLYWLVNFSS